jgi:HEAT repeat protein
LVAVPLAALVLFPFLRGSNRPPDRAPAPGYEFANVLALPSPPTDALSAENLADSVRRIASRLEWGSPEIVAYTQRQLPQDEETRRRLARRLEEIVRSYAEGSPLSARRFVETLGALGDLGSVSILLDYAQSGPDYLQTAAIRALAHCPSSDDVEDILARLTSSPNAMINSEARRAILGRDDFWTEQSLVDMLQFTSDSSVIRFIEEVGKRGLKFAADAVAEHLNSPQPATRKAAIQSLLQLRDPRGNVAAEEDLRREDHTLVFLTLNAYRDATTLPTEFSVKQLLPHDNAQVRQGLAAALGPSAGEALESEGYALAALRRLADDADAAVRRTAVANLFRRGHHQGLETYRDDLRRGHGGALKESVQFLCEELRDPAAGELIRQRLQTELDPLDEANLLFGLRFIGDPVDAEHYVSCIVRAGTSEDRRGGSQVYLSEYAALYIQDFGAAAGPALSSAMAKAVTIKGRLLMLDALRGVAKVGGPEVWEAILARLVDGEEDLVVRLAAADSLPFFDDPGLGPQVLALRDQLEDHRVVSRVLTIYVSFF